ncbi:MAG: hypothetical protein AB1941_15650 [Gemmatimonadota bacterium]
MSASDAREGWILGAVLVAVIGLFMLLGYFAGSPSDLPAAKDVVRNSTYDGSVYQVEEYLKRQVLRDPDSYESIEWGPVRATPAGFSVWHRFRARNGFGGYAVETYRFELDAAGAVVSYTEIK